MVQKEIFAFMGRADANRVLDWITVSNLALKLHVLYLYNFKK